MMKILFLHGWRSVPGGVKPTYLVTHGHDVLNPALPDEDFPAALAIAQNLVDTRSPDVVVGSSRGGAVAMHLVGTVRLVLLCPAWRKYGGPKRINRESVVLHSRMDDVIPFADSEELIRSSGLPNECLIEVGADHRLADPISLATMRAACEMGIRYRSISPESFAKEGTK